MEKWTEVRRRMLTGELSKRAACQEYGINWRTLVKMLAHAEPPGYQRRAKRAQPVVGPHLAWIHEVLEHDKQEPVKQRHTAKRIFDRLKVERGYTGGYTMVKDAVQKWKATTKEVCVPLSHPPGEAQVDFGFAYVDVAGERQQVALFVMSLPYSDAVYIQAFPRECTEAFVEGHNRAFRFIGGVPKKIRYDNSKIAVAKITGSRERQVTANTLAATLSGSNERDIYAARVRGYPSAVEAALFADNVPLAVYDQLIAAVREHLPTVDRYYDVRRRILGLDEIHHYDCYVPLVPELERRHTWTEAVDVIVTALGPLGSEYCTRLERGLRGRWCDRYPNAGKQSGAFSSGTYDSDPYILMNFQEEAIEHVFTLAHEAGHSMHTRYSAEAQPFQYSSYTIFVAEVASTFNEQLLTRLLLQRATTPQERAAIVAREIDSIRATIVRQTMFAEFERRSHACAEKGEPLTLERLRFIYRELLDAYFGAGFAVDEQLELECLRIPHFYSAFYVYKYATGLSAAITLAQRVADGVPGALDAYLGFLRGGSSKWPLDLLRDAGVDLESPEPVATALRRFGELVDELDRLL